MSIDPPTLIRDFGPLAVFVAVFFEQFGMPLPAMPMLLLTGAVAAADPRLGLIALISAVAASVAGGIVLFAFGDRKSTRLNSSHGMSSRMPSSA